MALFYIIFSSVCSLVIVHLLKYVRTTSLEIIHVLTINYLAAALLVALLKFRDLPVILKLEPAVLLVALAIGVVFIINFFVYSASVDYNGVGVSIASMRLSLLIPVLLSVIYYKEILNPAKWVGIVAVFSALILLIPNLKTIRISKYNVTLLIPLLFIFSGVGDAGLKIFQEEFNRQINETLFMGLVFSGAFIAGMSYIIWKKQCRFTPKEIAIGTAIGIPNIYSSIFLLWGLARLDGATAFSLVNILNVAGGTILGIIYWKDKVTQKQLAGLVTAMAAIILLIVNPT